jgi:hypothetical protein
MSLVAFTAFRPAALVAQTPREMVTLQGLQRPASLIAVHEDWSLEFVTGDEANARGAAGQPPADFSGGENTSFSGGKETSPLAAGTESAPDGGENSAAEIENSAAESNAGDPDGSQASPRPAKAGTGRSANEVRLRDDPPQFRRFTLSAAALVRWGAPPYSPPQTQILLTDGSRLVADLLGSDENELQVDSLYFGQIAIPLEYVAGILVQRPSDSLIRDRLVDAVQAAGKSRQAAAKGDFLVLHNGDRLSGSIQSIHPTTVQLVTEVGRVDLELTRVVAIGLDPALAERPTVQGLHAQVGFLDGSQLVVTGMRLDDQGVQITTPTGLKLRGDDPTQVIWLQPQGGDCTYLSSLKVGSYRHIPFLDLPWEFGLDRNVLGGRLRCDGRTYAKGIGLHSTARISFPLDGQYRRFAADLGIDQLAGPGGSVIFRVFVDGQERYVSPVVRGGETPLRVDVDVRGGQRISLVVNFAERGDTLDYADWLDARLIR